jgi:O-antigen/teichoic acid export membrane protein
VVVLSWVTSVVVSVAAAWLMLRLPRGPRRPGERLGALVRVQWRAALHHHALNQSLSAGPMLVPVVAAVVLGPVENAEFAMAWLIATFVFIPPYMLATALFAVSVKRSVGEFRASARHTLPAALALSLSLCAGSWLLGPFVLGILGGYYAAYSAPVLSVLVLGGLWMVVKDHLVAYARVTDQLTWATSLAAVCVALELVGALVGGILGGPVGVAAGWLTMIAVEAAVGTPIAWRVLRRRGTRDDDETRSRT